MSRGEQLQRRYAEKFSRNYLLFLLLIVGVLFFNVVRIFLIPILLATIFTALFFPLYEKMLKVTKGKESLSAISCCLIMLLGLMTPIYSVAHMISVEGIALFKSAVPEVQNIIEKGDAGLLGTFKNYPIIRDLNFDEINWQGALQDVAKNLGSIVTTVINKTSKGTFQIITDLFITLFTMFYFFRDGEKLVKRIKYLSPLDDVYEEGLIHRFVSVSRATIKGTVVIGIVQGALGGITLAICGVQSPILWGVVMVVLSVIPLVGGWLVLYPAAIIQLALGNVWQGITIFVVTIIIISNIDNLLRPRLVGRDAGMHDLMIFFSTLGGISVFGIIGFIIGPVIAVFFLTMLEIYSVEFKSTLDLAQKANLAKSAEQKSA